VGTFNIREFGKVDTDMPKLTALVASLDADVLAVQEIQSESKLRALAARLSGASRTYRVALSACGGKSNMRIGFLYDEHRLALSSTKEYPELAPGGDGSCTDGDRPGFLGVFKNGERTLHLLAIHLTFGSESGAVKKRRAQWERAHAIAAKLREGGATNVMILGDANSTGYRDDDQGERAFIDERARNAGMRVETSGIGCSEYWKKDGRYMPSLLDHAVATTGSVARGSARVHGYCAALRCAPHESSEPPDEHTSVSDHCPVTVDLVR
jgi:endonuclease/exonuclease/phosphatase family metal-dependent hydrolase